MPDPCTLVSARPAPPKTNISRQTEKHVSNQDINRPQPELQKALPPMLSHLNRTIRLFHAADQPFLCASRWSPRLPQMELPKRESILIARSSRCFPKPVSRAMAPMPKNFRPGCGWIGRSRHSDHWNPETQPLFRASPEQSELIRRLLSTDPDEVMPPPSEQKRLSAAQIELMQKWVQQGAVWKGHWSFEPIEIATSS